MNAGKPTEARPVEAGRPNGARRRMVRAAVTAGTTAAAVLLLAGSAWALEDPYRNLVTGQAFATWKLVLTFVLFVALAVTGNWVAKDVLLIQKQMMMWYGLVLAGAVLGLVLLLAIPIYVLGFIVAILAMAAPVAAYVPWRNARVPPASKVFTQTHLKRTINRILRREQMGEIAADRAVHVGAVEHLSEEYKLLYMKTNDFPIRIAPTSEQEVAAFTRAESIIYEALTTGAEQIHLTAQGGELLVRFRGDGAVREGGKLDKATSDEVVKFLKRLADMEVEEHRKPQTGRFLILLNEKTTTVIVQTAGSVKGENVVISLYPRELLEMRLAETGMRPEQVEPLVAALNHAGGGIVLMSSPPRSGRTVSMYAAVREFDLFSKNVIAVEKQINIDYAGVRQVEIDKSSGLTLAQTVQNVLRSDPDVVMVENIDVETAKMMLLGAAAGKTMIGGLQANDAAEGATRFIKAVGDAKSVGSTLLAVTNQRLMRKLCTACREAYRPNPEFLRKANLEAAKVDLLYREPKERPTNKKGEVVVCPMCRNEGYLGRTAIYEVMVLDDESRQALVAGRSISDIRTQLRKQGQEFLQEEGLRKVVAGVTSVSELLRVLKPAK